MAQWHKEAAILEKWYERAHRYGQTNLTEIDPVEADIGFWKDFWKRTGTQAIIVNAGGIVAYYPSSHKWHYRAAKLGGRDFFGEFAAAGREMGLAVLARMDINRALPEVYAERPEWFARRKDGSPYMVQGRYQSCLNSGYYKEYIPQVLAEIIERYHPDGFTDNSWTGIPRSSVCYCENCRASFRESAGLELPDSADYGDPAYRRWIEWSYGRRLENWDLFNRVTTGRGGEDCVWLGMVNANFVSSHASFCDLRAIARRSKIMMVDHQGRDGNGFEQNSLNGQLLHQLAGWDAVIPESMANYVRGADALAFRRAAAPPLEVQLWMYEGIAGGITPWWHIVGGAQEDARMYEACAPVLQWHRQYERYLYNRRPVANVAVAWSQANVEWFGAGQAHERVELSWRGICMALTRAGIPFLPVNADDMDEQLEGIDLLILPELAVLTEPQLGALERHAASGRSLLALGSVGLMSGDGAMRKSPRLERLLGVRFAEADLGDAKADSSWENPATHNYMRIEAPDHPLFGGFGRTATLPMGGGCRRVEIAADEGAGGSGSEGGCGSGKGGGSDGGGYDGSGGGGSWGKTAGNGAATGAGGAATGGSGAGETAWQAGVVGGSGAGAATAGEAAGDNAGCAKAGATSSAAGGETAGTADGSTAGNSAATGAAGAAAGGGGSWTGTRALATYIPPYPIYPPEFAWTDTKRTDRPVITEHRSPSGGTAIYVAWPLDASYGRGALPDHGNLLQNAVKYLLGMDTGGAGGQSADAGNASGQSADAGGTGTGSAGNAGATEQDATMTSGAEQDGAPVRAASGGQSAARGARSGGPCFGSKVYVECDAYIDCKVYSQQAGEQGQRYVIHLVNANHTGFDHGYAEKNMPVGPVTVTIKSPGFAPRAAFATEDGQRPALEKTGDGFSVRLERLGVHQLIVAE
jgi:hypothetical protein